MLEYKTLKFLLQPLVENAVFHGFDEIPYKGKLMIRIYEEAGKIIMTVADNGRGLSEAELEGPEPGKEIDPMNSIGIRNIRRRIELHFGEGFGLWITSEANSGTVAKIVIPVVQTELR